jgi:hypothetical protein
MTDHTDTFRDDTVRAAEDDARRSFLNLVDLITVNGSTSWPTARDVTNLYLQRYAESLKSEIVRWSAAASIRTPEGFTSGNRETPWGKESGGESQKSGEST